jgi:MFS family permease
MSTETRPQAPRWVRWLTAGGRPVVLLVALAMCAPGEYHLAEAAGWEDPWSYGMPLVLSAYAGIAAAVASTRYPGDRGRWSAIIGAGLALALAIAAQIVSHLITTGHVDEQQPWLIAVTSLVPPAVVGHLLHLAASPPSTAADSVTPRHSVAADPADTGGTGETPPEDEQHTEDAPPEEPRLLTSADVAEMFRVDKSTVRGWVASGRLTVHDKDTRGHNLFHPDALPQEAVR